MPLFNVTQLSVHFVILTIVTAYDKISKVKKFLIFVPVLHQT